MWPGEGVSYQGCRYNGGIDTGDQMRSARILPPCFSCHGCVNRPRELFQVKTRAGVGTDKEKRKCQSSLSSPSDKDKARLHPDRLAVTPPHVCVFFSAYIERFETELTINMRLVTCSLSDFLVFLL